MIGKVHDTARRRNGIRSSFAWLTCALIALATLGFSSMVEAAPRLFDHGRRWIGRSVTTPVSCTGAPNWLARPMFKSPEPPGTEAFCRYAWQLSSAPRSTDIDALMLASRAAQMTEDVPSMVPQARGPWSPQEVEFFEGLRASLPARVGSVSTVPIVIPEVPVARIVVIDSAADAAHGQISPGQGTRHGDTLAHLIEDLVCMPRQPNGYRECAAEVTTALALPWVESGADRPHGGHTGSPAELAEAIHRATQRWIDDRAIDPVFTPRRLILNLSLGWEHTSGVADCYTSGDAARGLPVTAVEETLKQIAAEDVLVIAAAGNQSGGLGSRTGLLCPGAFQRLPHPDAPSTSLLYAVTGLDASDRPLTSARELGHTGIAAYGFGAVAWRDGDPVPPALTGSSVSTAVVSAVAALVLAHRPDRTNTEVAKAIYEGGYATNKTADACPRELPRCIMLRRANLCGALKKVDDLYSCDSPGPGSWSSPRLPSQVSALVSSITAPATPAPAAPIIENPHSQRPSAQVQPWTFPQPISVTCPTCVVTANEGSTPPELWLPALGRQLFHYPMLIIYQENGDRSAYRLLEQLEEGVSYRFALPAAAFPPSSSKIRAAYISGFDLQMLHSVTEEIFVHRNQ